MFEVVAPRLRRGDRIAIVSPASYANADLVRTGCERLAAFGYEPVVMPNALERGPLYYAGTAAQRVADLHAAFGDKSIRGICCTRGGWGSAELLPLLDADLIRANLKAFVGYSDHTSLHAWFWNECQMQTFYAPMVAADWSKTDGVDVPSWNAALETVPDNGTWKLGPADGMSVLREGFAEGRLLGGCLSIITEALGAPWALRIGEPCVLFLEDIGTKPYKWDRLLQHLRFAGMLERVTGIVLGDMSANVEAAELPLLRDACIHALRGFRGPISIGLRCGHVETGNRSLVLGARVRLTCNAEAPELRFHA